MIIPSGHGVKPEPEGIFDIIDCASGGRVLRNALHY